jgi:MFS family permease
MTPADGAPLRGPSVHLPNAPGRPAPAAGHPRAPGPPTAPGVSRGGPFAALRHRDFRIFYWGHILSLTGTWMQSTAQGWLVLELTDSEVMLGLVTATASAPVLLFTLYAGVLADRADKRTIMLFAQVLSLVVALCSRCSRTPALITVGWILLSSSSWAPPTPSRSPPGSPSSWSWWGSATSPTRSR